MKNQKAIICDIDGCLLDTSGIEIKDNDFKSFHEKANSPIWSWKKISLFNLLNNYTELGYKVILLTARSEEIRHQTYNYLIKSGGTILKGKPILLMRKIGDTRPAHEMKEELLLEQMKNYYIEFAIDDEQENCEMFRNYGILTFKVIN